MDSNEAAPNDLQVWIDLIGNDLPDIATLRHLTELINQKVVICGNAETMNRLTEYFEGLEIEFHPENTNTGDPIDEFSKFTQVQCNFIIKAHDRRYMLLEPELKQIRQDPFWTQQGKRTKGKRGRY